MQSAARVNLPMPLADATPRTAPETRCARFTLLESSARQPGHGANEVTR